MKFLILKNNRSKEVRKVFEKLDEEQKGNERHTFTLHFFTWCFLKKKRKAEKS